MKLLIYVVKCITFSHGNQKKEKPNSLKQNALKTTQVITFSVVLSKKKERGENQN